MTASGANRDSGANLNLERDVHPIGVRVELRRIFFHAAGQPALLRKCAVEKRGGSLDSFRV